VPLLSDRPPVTLATLKSSDVLGGYTRVYGVYQPPVFFDSVSHLSDHK